MRNMNEKEALLLEGLRVIAATAPGSGSAVAVAYSGGLDSRFVVHMAKRAGLAVRALHVNGPHIPAHEHAYAVAWAEHTGVALTVVNLDPLAMPVLRVNPTDRCYHCKKAVFTALRDAAGGLPLCDGTNASDLGEYRPGLRALAELAVRSPLAEAGITKEEVRDIGGNTGLENPDQAALPCLLTRFGYGEILTSELLLAVDAAETAVKKVLAARGYGAAAFRVRFEDAVTPALHLARKPFGASLSPPLSRDLAVALESVGFRNAPVRLTDSLSGYFDKRSQSETGSGLP